MEPVFYKTTKSNIHEIYEKLPAEAKPLADLWIKLFTYPDEPSLYDLRILIREADDTLAEYLGIKLTENK